MRHDSHQFGIPRASAQTLDAADAHRFVRPDWRRTVRPGFERHHPFALYEQKYDPNQPRVPSGTPAGGQWTSDGSSSGLSSRQLPVLLAAWPSNAPPEIPENRPPTSAERTRLAKLVAFFVRGSVERFLTIAAGIYWLYNERAKILSYSDPPKTLKELQDAVSPTSQAGYQDHHIVEQMTAEADGFPRSQIDSRENIARIPTLKHQDITAWFNTMNKDFGGLSPRDYLRGRSWEERRDLGLFALRKFGVLKP